jgi:carbonic anhydrase
MSCNATGPINIVHTDNRCFGKCRFNYEFQKSQAVAENKGTYISITLDTKDNIVAEYSSANTPLCGNGEGSSKLTVSELRIYAPSLHKFGTDQKNTDAELFIILNNSSGGRNLVICLPISTLNGTLPTATSNLTSIINYLGKVGNSDGSGGSVKGLNFDLNSFIPKKGYYSYTGSLPWNACEKCTDFIIYDKNDAVIGLNNLTMSTLLKLVTTSSNITIVDTDHEKVGFAYNKRGAIRGFGSANDKIWINCYPTGSDGEILVEESKSNILNNNSFGMFSGLSQDKFQRIMMLSLTVVLVLLTVGALGFVIGYLPRLLMGKKENLPRKPSKVNNS